jgi:DNA-binding NtrC family response regulator
MYRQNNQSGARPLIGSSPAMQRLSYSVAKLDGQRWPVLILGETGTGKELVARLIHERGTAGPFIVVDCSAIPAALMESELFGATRGAYTGANVARIGLIEAAHNGTAFFDEIGELPLELQAKLLRVLQEKEFRPVGATHPKRSDFRVIAATNRDLSAEVERNAFRRDLFFRLKVVTMRVPPLRDRREDIPDLIEHFLSRYGQRHTLTPEAMRSLLAYDWPGNIRELENCIQHMVAVNDGPLLHLHDMPSTILNTVHLTAAPLLGMAAAVGASVAPEVNNAKTSGSLDHMDTVVPLLELEKREILKAMRLTRGDRGAAARLLGIGRTTLYRKLRDYGFHG